MLELIAGVVVAIIAVALVLGPLAKPGRYRRESVLSDLEPAALEESDSPKIKALIALREVEFDRETGKLSEADYVSLKNKYSAEAIEAIETENGGDSATEDDLDPVELAVQRARSSVHTTCPVCSGNLESGAVFCPACGCAVVSETPHPRCWVCGANTTLDAKFCASCGVKSSMVERTEE